MTKATGNLDNDTNTYIQQMMQGNKDMQRANQGGQPEAVALLEGTPAPTAAVPANPSRAARNPNVGANGGAQVSPQQAAAARWDAHLKAATPAARRRA